MTNNTLTDRQKQIAGFLLVAIALAALPWFAGMLGNSWVRVLNIALLYVMLALGLNIVVGFAGLLDLGYIAFYADKYSTVFICSIMQRHSILCSVRIIILGLPVFFF